jgi:hypothetical protein
MDTLNYDYFFRKLKDGKSIDETCFYFADDPQVSKHYIGFLPKYEKPYWVGYCDIHDGCQFHTAEELVGAKIFDGKSLKERWANVRIISIWTICLDDWLNIQRRSDNIIS